MITGWELLEPARRRGSRFVRAVVRFGEHAREVPIDKLESVLSSQIYQDDFTLDDPESENARFDFVVWDADGSMWYRGIRDGLVELRRMWSTPESWLAARDQALEILSHIPDVPPAPGDEMPDDIAAAVEREVGDQYPPEAAEVLRDIAPRTDRTDEQRAWADEFLAEEDEVPEKLEPFDMQAALGLSDREWVLMRTKWVVVSDIRRMLEDAGIDAPALAEAAGEDAVQVERWLRGVVRHVSLDTLTVLYAAAAEKAEWPDLEGVIRGLPERDE